VRARACAKSRACACAHACVGPGATIIIITAAADNLGGGGTCVRVRVSERADKGARAKGDKIDGKKKNNK
jgi:hypothetical protein